MGTPWRRCSDCGKRRAIPAQTRCRPCHGAALLLALDRIEVKRGEMNAWHQFQHERHDLTPETCDWCVRAREAQARIDAA